MTRNREIVLTFIVVLVGVACVASLAHSSGMKLSDAASWAQAIGTVAAILATIAMTNRQLNAARQDRIDLIEAIAEAMRIALDTWTDVETAVANRNVLDLIAAYGVLKIERWKAMNRFVDLDIDRWPNALYYTHAMELRGAFDRFNTAVAPLASGDIPPDDDRWKTTAAFGAEMRGRAATFFATHARIMAR